MYDYLIVYPIHLTPHSMYDPPRIALIGIVMFSYISFVFYDHILLTLVVIQRSSVNVVQQKRSPVRTPRVLELLLPILVLLRSLCLPLVLVSRLTQVCLAVEHPSQRCDSLLSLRYATCLWNTHGCFL